MEPPAWADDLLSGWRPQTGGGGVPSAREHRHPGRNSLTADEGKESGLWWALVGSSCPMMVLAA